MYENVVVSPEEAAEKINPSSCVEKQIDRVKEFCSDLEKYGYTITSMLEGIVESTLLKKELSFSVGIEYQGELLLQDKETYSWRRQQLEKSEMQKGTYDLIKQCFLEQNGLTPGEDVTIEYRSEHSELAALMASGEAEIALLPQPFVTSVLNQNENVKVVLDLTQEWNKVTEGKSDLTMGCIVVQKEFAEEHPQEMKAFLEEYQASVEYITNEANLDDAAELVEKADIIQAAVAKKALPECNIVFIVGEEMKSISDGFLQVIYDSVPALVGGALPEEDFYYQQSVE